MILEAIEPVKQQHGNDFDKIEFCGIESDIMIVLYKK